VDERLEVLAQENIAQLQELRSSVDYSMADVDRLHTWTDEAQTKAEAANESLTACKQLQEVLSTLTAEVTASREKEAEQFTALQERVEAVEGMVDALDGAAITALGTLEERVETGQTQAEAIANELQSRFQTLQEEADSSQSNLATEITQTESVADNLRDEAEAALRDIERQRTDVATELNSLQQESRGELTSLVNNLNKDADKAKCELEALIELVEGNTEDANRLLRDKFSDGLDECESSVEDFEKTLEDLRDYAKDAGDDFRREVQRAERTINQLARKLGEARNGYESLQSIDRCF